jgi:hypothetical protein
MAQGAVADGMAVAVVDQLEGVEVADQQARRSVVARAVGERPRQVAQKTAPVEDAGQGILMRQRLELRRLGARRVEGGAQPFDSVAQILQFGLLAWRGAGFVHAARLSYIAIRLIASPELLDCVVRAT